MTDVNVKDRGVQESDDRQFESTESNLGKCIHYVNPVDYKPVAKQGVRYFGIDTLLLIVEDDEKQRRTLEALAEKYSTKLSEGRNLSVCAVRSTKEAVEELAKYEQYSPQASLKAVLDYHMGLNLSPGERKPTEALFYEPNFLDLAKNGSIIVIYSGYVSYARQSPEIFRVAGTTPEMVLLLAEKGVIKPEEVIRVMTVRRERIPQLREDAVSNHYDLKTLVEKSRARVKARKP